MDREDHQPAVLACHERIAGRLRNGEYTTQWCALLPYAWCYEHDIYVCDIHHIARHPRCRAVIEFPRNRVEPEAGGVEFRPDDDVGRE
jgi:hypothetical protein